jgi:hypothetical protein
VDYVLLCEIFLEGPLELRALVCIQLIRLGIGFSHEMLEGLCDSHSSLLSQGNPVELSRVDVLSYEYVIVGVIVLDCGFATGCA